MTPAHQAKMLTGSHELWRIRVGDYRIVQQRVDPHRAMDVLFIASATISRGRARSSWQLKTSEPNVNMDPGET
jgi:mRNA-degrading endonuclease RelE of RelBE toxin-antitoxin system